MVRNCQNVRKSKNLAHGEKQIQDSHHQAQEKV